MAADRNGRNPRDPLDQLRADRERHLAEERADATASAVPPPDWHHDTLELDLDALRHDSAAAGPPPVVDGSVLRSRTHGGGWRAVRRGSGAAVRGGRRVRVPAGLVAGVVLLVGAGAASAVLDGSGTGPQTSPLQTTTTQTGPGTTGTTGTTGGDQPQGSVRVGTDSGGGSGAGLADGSAAGRGPQEQPAGPPAPGGGAQGAPAGPAGGPAAGPGGGGTGGGPGGGPAGGPAAGGAGAPGRP